MVPTRADATRLPRCPTCGAPVVWVANSQRPFCSIACRLIDLGGWLDERFRVPAEPATGHEVDAASPSSSP